MILFLRRLALIFIFPIAAQAQIYKCTQPDGSNTYQDHECSAGAASTKTGLGATSPSPASTSSHSNVSAPNPQVINSPANPSRGDASALSKAVMAGDKGAVKSMIEKGADVNYADYWFQTPLDYALKKIGWSDIVQLMINHGAICGAVRNNSSPINTAVDIESIKLVKACVLKQTGIPPSLNDTFYHAIRRGEPQLATALLTLGADINGQTKLNGQVPLFATLQAKNPEEMLLFLLNHGANVNASGKSGMTLLATLKSIGKPEYTKLIPFLLAHGADPNISRVLLNVEGNEAICHHNPSACNPETKTVDSSKPSAPEVNLSCPIDVHKCISTFDDAFKHCTQLKLSPKCSGQIPTLMSARKSDLQCQQELEKSQCMASSFEPASQCIQAPRTKNCPQQSSKIASNTSSVLIACDEEEFKNRLVGLHLCLSLKDKNDQGQCMQDLTKKNCVNPAFPPGFNQDIETAQALNFVRNNNQLMKLLERREPAIDSYSTGDAEGAIYQIILRRPINNNFAPMTAIIQSFRKNGGTEFKIKCVTTSPGSQKSSCKDKEYDVPLPNYRSGP